MKSNILSFFKDKKVLITGGTGYIGSCLAKKIRNYCDELDILGKETEYSKDLDNVFYLDITDKQKFENFFSNRSYDLIYHFAALIDIKNSLTNPYLYYKVNSIGTLNLIEILRKKRIFPHVIFNSTGLVYGNPQYLPIDEKHSINPNNPYSSSKIIAENILHTYSVNYGYQITIFRLFTVFGPNQRSNLFIPSFIQRSLRDKKIAVGNLYPTRDFIYIDDVIDALISAINYNKKNLFNIYNIAGGKEYSIKDVVSIILKATNRSFDDVVQDEKLVRLSKNEVKRIFVDISKAKDELNWSPQHDLKTGIIETINSFKT